MSTLNGQPIKDTYPGLIKTTDNAAIDGTLKALEDGAGNTLPIEVSATGINFTGTVTGVPVGVESIVAGTNVTVDATDPANPIVNAAGGGGGGAADIGIVTNPAGTGDIGSQKVFRYNMFNTTGGVANQLMAAGGLYCSPTPYTPGSTIEDFAFKVPTSVAGATFDVGIYSNILNASGRMTPGVLIGTIATGIDASVIGSKEILGANILLTPSVYGVYWVAFLPLGGNPTAWKNSTQQFFFGGFTGGTADRIGLYRDFSGYTSLPADVSSVVFSAGNNESVLFGTR